MKKLLGWTLRAFPFLLLIIAVDVATDWEFYKETFSAGSLIEDLLIVLGGSLALGVVFYVLETMVLPRMKKGMKKKIVRIFDAREVQEDVFQFEVNGIDVWAELTYRLKMSSEAGGMELVFFHIAEENKDKVKFHPIYMSKDRGQIMGMPTIKFYGTNRMGLKLAKKRLHNRVGVYVN